MARKLSFSVESILSGELSVSTSILKNDSSRMEIAEERPLHYCAAALQLQQQQQQQKQQHGGHHQRSLSSSVISMGVQRLPTPPTSPLSVASAPSPITDSMLDDDQNESIIEVQSEGNEDDDAAVTPLSQGSDCSKKGRMRFSQEQIQTLEQRFQEQQYLLPADRKILSVTLRMTERQIKTWFQNKRAQYKRARHMSSSSVTTGVHPGFMMATSVPRPPLYHHHSHSAKLGGAIGSITPLPTTPMSTQAATPLQYNQMAFRFPPIPSLVQPIPTCLAPPGVPIQHTTGLTSSSPSPFAYNTEHKHFVLAPPLSPVVMGTSSRLALSPLPMLTRPFPL